MSIGNSVPPSPPTWGGVTVRNTRVIAVEVPLVPVTVKMYEPKVVRGEATTIRVVVKLGAPELGLNKQEVPEGNPLHERLTGWDLPPNNVTLTVLDPDPPSGALIIPEFVMSQPTMLLLLIAQRFPSEFPA